MLLVLALLASIDMTAALDAMCSADRGALWGRSLCGPTVLVDPGGLQPLDDLGTIQGWEKTGSTVTKR